MKLFPSFVIVLALAAAGCGEDNVPTDPGPITDLSIARVELFQGTIGPGGTAFYSFNVLADRGVAMMLASITDASGAPLDMPMVLGFGVPQGTGCGVTRSVTTRPALQAQIFNGTPVGTYCVNLADAGELSSTVTFSVRIRQEPDPQADAAPGTVTFSSQVAPGGATTRSFMATRPGNVEIIVDSVSPSSARLGLGVGIPRFDGSGCVPMRTLEITTSSGTAMTVPVDLGTFCARVFDLGSLTSPASFSIRIVHP
jgi:hypothetical protein